MGDVGVWLTMNHSSAVPSCDTDDTTCVRRAYMPGCGRGKAFLGPGVFWEMERYSSMQAVLSVFQSFTEHPRPRTWPVVRLSSHSMPTCRSPVERNHGTRSRANAPHAAPASRLSL